MNASPVNDEPPLRPPRGWRHKFGDAFRGLRLGVRGQSSFAVHFFFAVLAVVAAVVFRCTWVEWCLVAACIGAVLAAELFNTSIELLFRGLDAAARDRVFGCLDIAAGAVFVTSATAAVIGGTVFVRRLLICFEVLGE